MKQLLAVDWGTTSLRGALLDGTGSVTHERSSANGLLNVRAGGFAEVLEAEFGDWLRVPGTLCLMAGMVGSKQGWQEAPYCASPAGLAEVAQHLTWIERTGRQISQRIAVVPGMSCENEGVPDVMRGEETQVFGALQLLGMQEGVFVLPGTHSKWVRVQAGRIEGLATFMTGEFYALLRQHSILARTLPAVDDELDGAAFDEGVALALRRGSLLGTAFSVRTLSLFARKSAQSLPSYLSGLVIGEELRAQSLGGVEHVVLIGSDTLTQRYARALAQCRVGAHSIGALATWRGLWAIAQTLESR
jgi:2-dehydro-3-deoxygalactonokinase